MDTYRVIVIGASAGGVEALGTLFRDIKANINAAIFVVLHIAPSAKSYLPEILGKHANIPVIEAVDGQRIEPGTAYVAPPDRHLIIQDGVMRLSFGPKINHTRPAIDPLFETAAKQHGPAVIGVILSGHLYDGTRGLLSIKQAGGTAVVQDPEDALFRGMPDSALLSVPVDYSVPVSNMAALLNELSEQAVLEEGAGQMDEPATDFSDDEIELIRKDIEQYEKGLDANQRSVLTCPDCGGVMWEIQNGKLVRYRCHTGHIFNAENLLSSQDEDLEKALWTAIRVLIEKAAVSNRLAISAKERGDWERELYYLSVAREAEEQTRLIRTSWFSAKEKDTGSPSAGEQATENITHAEEDQN